MLKLQNHVTYVKSCRSLMGHLLNSRWQMGIPALVCLMTMVQTLSAQMYITTNTTESDYLTVVVAPSKNVPLPELNKDVRNKLLEHWDEFPFVDNELPAHEDEGEAVIDADGIVGTDKWQRLVMNTKPVVIGGKRYSAFRFKSVLRGGRDIYFGMRKPRTSIQWYITAKSEAIRGFTEYYPLKTNPALPYQYVFQKLDKTIVKDKEEYMVVIAFTDEKPYEIAFRYDNTDGRGGRDMVFGSNNSTEVRIHVPGMAMDTLPLDKVRQTRASMGIVLADHQGVVCGVVKDSPADRAGLKPGDMLLKIDGHNADRSTNLSLYRMEGSKRSREISIEYMPEGEKQSKVVELTLAEVNIESLRTLRKSFDREKYTALYGSTYDKHNMGQRLLRDKNLADQKDEAILFLESAAKDKNDASIFELATMYEKGKGITKDDAKAISIYRYLADSKKNGPYNLKARFELGRRYQTGTGVEADINEAVKWYKSAETDSSGYAAYALGEIYLTNQIEGAPDLDLALKYFTFADKKSVRDAAYQLGKLHAKRADAASDAMAISFYTKAADNGSSLANVELGKYYELGRGVPQDYAKAIRCYNAAGTSHNPEAALRAGFMMVEGRGYPVHPRIVERGQQMIRMAHSKGVTMSADPPAIIAKP